MTNLTSVYAAAAGGATTRCAALAVRRSLLRALAPTLLAVAAAVSAPPSYAMASFAAVCSGTRTSEDASAAAMVRTELYFGRAMADGRSVGAPQWRRFVDSEVTPRFPQGFTVLAGTGQYRMEGGAIVHEGSRVLVVLHPMDVEVDRHLEALRERYKRAFAQQSVLRVDSAACASF